MNKNCPTCGTPCTIIEDDIGCGLANMWYEPVKPEWISVDDALAEPKPKTRAFVNAQLWSDWPFEVMVAEFDEKYWWVDEDVVPYKVTHYMPIDWPEPPEVNDG